MILFLDFDGVLHPTHQDGVLFEGVPVLAAWLQRWSGVQVVVSSSWRVYHPQRELAEMLGPVIAERLVGCTPLASQMRDPEETADPPRPERQREVEDWMAASWDPGRAWVALDDMPELFDAGSDRLVVCDGTQGISCETLKTLDRHALAGGLPMQFSPSVASTAERCGSVPEGALAGAPLVASRDAMTLARLPNNPATIASRVLALLDNPGLRSSVQAMGVLQLSSIRQLAERAVSDHDMTAHEGAGLIGVDPRMVEALEWEELLTTSSLLFDSLEEAEHYFGFRFAAIEARSGHPLDPAVREWIVRVARFAMTAAAVLGDHDNARAYWRTRNFALGGATPAHLLETAEGEQVVLDELQAQATGAPL